MISISVTENLKHIFYLKCNIVENSFLEMIIMYKILR